MYIENALFLQHVVNKNLTFLSITGVPNTSFHHSDVGECCVRWRNLMMITTITTKKKKWPTMMMMLLTAVMKINTMTIINPDYVREWFK